MIRLPENSDGSPQPLLLKDEEVASLLGISRRSVWRLVSSGRLPEPVRLGGSVRWRYQDIADWVGGL